MRLVCRAPHTLLLFLLIFLPGCLAAQQIISNTSQQVNYAIPFRPASGNGFVYGNQLLREMAKDVLREPWLVRIRISGALGLKIVKAGEHHQLFISWKHQAISGDTAFRHFPVTDVLFPSRISMKLRWANRADTSGYAEQAVAEKQIHPADSVLCFINVAPFDPQVDTLLVREVELFYDSAALRSFFGRIELIHDYYASVLLLDSLGKFTANLHLEQVKNLPVNYLKIEEVCRVIERIDARDFRGRLLRNGYDPLGLMPKYDRMFKHSRSLVYNFMDELHKAGTIPVDGDGDTLAACFTSRIFLWVGRSYLMDQQQGRIYNDCLDHFFDHGTFPPEENVEMLLLAKMFPDAAQDTISRYISKCVYASYLHTARQLIDQRQFAEAYSMMENGQKFIDKNPAMKGFVVDDLLQSQAAQGICNSYIGIASACISSHKYSMAEAYLAKADQYAMAHPKYIRTDSIYRAVFSELFFLRNTDCDQLLDQKKYAEALECYQQFESAYSPRDLSLVSKQLDEKKSMASIGLGKISVMLSEDALKRKNSDTALYYFERATALRQDAGIQRQDDVRLDSLAPVMAGIKYNQIFKEGALALEKRRFTLAVTKLREAKMLAVSSGIDRSREFDSLYRQAMKNYLIVQLSASQKKIWANQFDSALAALHNTEAAGFDYGLLNDDDFLTAIAGYKIKIREQKCRNLQDTVDLRVIRADRSAALKNYMNAIRYFQEALKFSRLDSVCRFAQKPLNDSLVKYKSPAEYQRNEQSVNARITVGDYTGAIDLWMENQILFRVSGLSRFGLTQIGFFEFIAGRNNPYLTETAAGFMLKTGKSADAFGLLTLLRDQGVTAKQVKPLQEDVAKALAGSDMLVNPAGNIDTALLKYPVANDWYRSFREAYAVERQRKR